MLKEFPVADVLSVITGRLHGEVGGVYAVLNHMTGDSLFTHQLPRAAGVCGPVLKKRFPDLPSDGYFPDIAAAGGVFGVSPLPAGVWESKDPIAEMVEMVGRDRTVVVVSDDRLHGEQPRERKDGDA